MFLNKLIEQFFRMRLYAGEGGAGGGGTPEPAPTPAPTPAPAPSNLDMSKYPEDLANDEAFQAELKALIGEPEEPKPEEPKPEEPKPEEPKPDDKKPDEKDQMAGDEDEDFEIDFENDLDIGDVKFTKEELKKLPENLVENVGRLKVALDEQKAKATEYETDKAELLKDPIIRDRLERKANGKASEHYALAGVTKESHAAITAALTEKGLSAEDANAIFGIVQREILTDMKLYGQAVLNNALIESDTKAAAARTVDSGKTAIKELAGMSKDLSEDIVRDWCQDPARKGSAKNGGLDYADLLRLKDSIGPEALFAAIAKAKNIPVVLNAKDRDKKMIASERAKYIEATGAKRVAKAMQSQSTGTATGGAKGGTIDNEGGIIDKSKLNDYDYVEGLMAKAKSDDEIFEIQRLVRQQAKD